jgi:hypothetical protein
MGVTYTKGSDVSTLEPEKLAEQLQATVSGAMAWLKNIPDAEAAKPEREGKWSAKQVIGHLTDSAINNLVRVVRLQIEHGAKLTGYEQEHWVNLQHYGEREWTKVLDLWATLNEQFAWTVARIERAKLANRGEVEGSELTLGFLIEDYIAHMEHHLRSLRKTG